MNISYSKLKIFKECPKHFYLEYIEKTPHLVPKNEYFTLYGRLVEKFFEMYCNTWRHKTSNYMPPEEIRMKMVPLYEGIVNNSVVLWSHPMCKLGKEDIFENAYRDVCNIMDSSNINYFLNTESEITVKLKMKDSNEINGRLDFIFHKQPEKDIVFDGKGSSKIGQFVNENQLFFYALLYFFKFKKLPTELGFFYYRFNTFVPVEFNKDILNTYRAQLSLDIKNITTASKFNATPSAQTCRFCPYSPKCLEHLKEKGKRAKASKLDLEGDGLIVFGL